MVIEESVFTAHTAKAIAPLVAVVTAGQFGEVSFERALGLTKVTSSGVPASIPDTDPHHHPTCSLVPQIKGIIGFSGGIGNIFVENPASSVISGTTSAY